MGRSRWVPFSLLCFQLLFCLKSLVLYEAAVLNVGFLFGGFLLFQVVSWLLDRSMNPDVLNRHKQVRKMVPPPPLIPVLDICA